MSGKPLWSQADGDAGQDADRLRRRRLAGPPQGPRLSSSTTTTSSRSSPPTTATGKELWRVAPRRRQQLGDAVRLGERAAHRDRHRRHRQDPVLRPGRQAPVGAQGDVDLSPFRRRSPATACSTSPRDIRPTSSGRSTRFARGRSGDISLKPEQTSNDFIVWSDPGARHRTTRRRSSTATAITRSSTAGSSPATIAKTGQGNLSVGSGSRWTPPASRRRCGPTTARSSR